MARPKVTQKNNAKRITLAPPACLLPLGSSWCRMFPKVHTPCHPRDGCIPDHLLQLLCGPVLTLTSTGVSMGTLTGLQIFNTTDNKLRCTVYSDTQNQHWLLQKFEQQELICWIIWANLNMTLSLVPYRSFLGSLLIDIDHCRLGKPHESCIFGNSLTQLSSHHNVALVYLAQILMLAHFSYHPLTGAMMKRKSVSVTSPVSLHNTIPDYCILYVIDKLIDISKPIKWHI